MYIESNMFNLETAILAWRRPYEMHSALSDEDVEELEGSLRDRMAALMNHGMPEEEAFHRAVQRAGTYATADTEYRKVYWGKRKRLKELRQEIQWRIAMVKNFFKVAFRNLFQHKVYTFVNISGLSIGLACSFFILLWVTHEVSFDRFHEKGDRIYRVLRNETNNEEVFTRRSVAGPMAEVIVDEYPEIEMAVAAAWEFSHLVRYGDAAYREEGNYVGADFFNVFSFPLIQGDPDRVLEAENSVAISEELAAKLFGTDWLRQNAALGEIINIDGQRDFTITGIYENPPNTSTMDYDVLLSMEGLMARNPWSQQWGANAFALFVLVKEGVSVADLNEKVAGLMTRHSPEEEGEVVFLTLFEEMHLYDNYENGVRAGGRILLIRLFLIIVVFLLVIACINFMNLATARSAQRSREIGVRKAIGASKPSLAGQFLAETLILAGIAFVVALILLIVLLPSFNTLTGIQIGILDLSPSFLLGTLGIAGLTGLLAGSYPAMYLSSFNPIHILRGSLNQKPGAARLRKVLSVFQFALSTLIIVCTTVIYFQIQYIMEKDLGLDRSHVISVGLEGEVQNQYETFRQELMNRPGIVNVTASSHNPLSVNRSTSGVSWEGKDPDNEIEFNTIFVNYDFVETMKMEMVAGRSHSRLFGADSVGFVINEQAALIMEQENPVGAPLTLWEDQGQVIGVVKDFHMTSFEAPIRPTILILLPENTAAVWVRTEPGKTAQAIEELEDIYTSLNEGYPFAYRFMDQDYESMYQGTIVLGKLANIFAIVAMLISCLGLFGLASFTAERRTKEIGIRKVLGASTSYLVMLLSLDFTRLVLIGFVMGAPLAWFISNRWLQEFEYRIDISPLTFIIAGILVFVIAQLTVSAQSVKAAMTNPVNSLRNE